MTRQVKMELKKCGIWKPTNINHFTIRQLIKLFEPFFLPDLFNEITN